MTDEGARNEARNAARDDERDDVRDHQASELARRRAARAGLDLDTLRRDAPDQYRMLNAEEIVRVSPELAEVAAELVWELFEERRVYRVPGEGVERLLAFPPLGGQELERFDDAAADLVARPAYETELAFFRTVRDLRGTRRELMLPTPPEAWHGEAVLVGPFRDREEAEGWPAGRLPPELMADPLPYRGRWFCDVFRGDEDLIVPEDGAAS